MHRAAVRATDSRFRLLAENGSGVVFQVNADFVGERFSPSVAQMLGFEPGDLIGRSMIELIHPDEVSRVFDFVLATRT